MPHRVFVTRPIPREGLMVLEEACEVSANREDRVLTKEEIIRGVEGRDGLLCLLTDRIDAEVMDSGNLLVISNYAMGYDNIDVDEATARGIMVTNTPVDGLKETPADFTFALLLALSRRVCEGDQTVREGGFTGWSPQLLLGRDVHQKTLGIVGAGRIGSAVAKRATGFGMKILYADHHRKVEVERETGAEHVSLDYLLSNSDFITIHVPLNFETKHMIARSELAQMKETSFLINTSRGPVVDEAALVEALKSSAIAGAALDVYEEEPRVHPELLRMPNVILTPHMASASVETRTEMAISAAENLLEGLSGRRPPFLVNPQVLSYRSGE